MPFDATPRERERRLVIDSFAGLGGASHGITVALGRAPDFAINHDPEAIGLHRINHKGTRHFCEDVYKVDPRDLVDEDEVVDLLWASPDCKHFSKAKGGKPVSKKVRGLAWVVIGFAKKLSPSQRPRRIVVENVEEFADWGPLLENDKPDKKRKGLYFRRWVGHLRGLGYTVEWKQLRACDYGAPTFRKRLYIIARCDGLPIVWPEPTHCDPKKLDGGDLFASTMKPWRIAAECIDFSIPVRSIFGRKKDLAEKTQRRIAKGLDRYVFNNPHPYIVDQLGAVVRVAHGDVDKSGKKRGKGDHPLTEPLPTATASNEFALVTPFITPVKTWGGGGNGPASVEDPMRTVTTSKRGEHALVAPIIVPVTHGGDDRVHSSQDPLRVVTTAHGGEFALAAVTMIQTGYGEREGQEPRALSLDVPHGTVVAGGCKTALVAAFLAKHYGGVVGQKVTDPSGTVTTKDHHALVTTNLVVFRNHTEAGLDEPAPTVTAGGTHIAEVRAFLIKYFGNEKGGQPIDEPIDTVTTKERFALVIVTINGVDYVVVDIGMRMLTPRELARAQGFPDSFVLSPTRPMWNAKTRSFFDKKLSKTAQVRLVGNSVCPPVANAIVRANMPRTP